MPLLFENTGLWKRTLAQRNNDDHSHAREKLRSAFFNMRSHAEQLVTLIPEDCRGLTVHDITHLDALWEMADIIAGADFDINPAEAFVFGATVLIHDAGMSVASYPKGLEQISKTTEWRDTAFGVLKRNGLPPSDTLVDNPPTPLLPEILFHVLRALHARHAEDLVFATWPLPSGGESVRLLEDLQLRTSYGRTIGRIAHSHHWGIEKVVQQLRNSVGAAASLPQDWKVDEIKVACLLRCADAAHIDHRRAPSMLLALRKPQSTSEAHWNFQNKLNKPTVSDGTLIYSSGQHFEIPDSSAWWLCFDTIRIINKEIQDSNAVLQDSGLPSLRVKRVYGAEGPSILSRQIQVAGWRPVDAEVRVTDPINLARNLGGRNLYGRSLLAPIRELLQNAVDAVRARRKNEKRPDTWGKIRLSVERLTHDANDILLHIDDDGIGMSERTLVGPLLDFGNSFWNSGHLLEEWPGLESSGLEPIGKFGIGFFSIFMLGGNIKVASRRYDSAASDTRTLEFSSLDSRPILRDALSHELPSDYSTRISVKLDDNKYEEQANDYSGIKTIELTRDEALQRAYDKLVTLISSVDVDIELNFEGRTHRHAANWLDVDPKVFLTEALADFRGGKDVWVAGHASLLTRLEDEETKINYGRAAISMYNTRYEDSGGGYSIGGFVTKGSGENWFTGVIKGEIQDAARTKVKRSVPDSVLANWASKQAELIDHNRFEVRELFAAARTIHRLGGDPKKLPFCLSGGQFISLQNLHEILQKYRKVHLPLNTDYRNSFELIDVSNLKIGDLHKGQKENLIVTEWHLQGDNLLSEEDSENIIEANGGPVELEQMTQCRPSVERVANIAHQIWKTPTTFFIEEIQLYNVDFFKPPAPEWVLTLKQA